MLEHLKERPRKRNERGASLVEYALLVALIAVVCIAAVTFVGTSSSGKIGGAGGAIRGRGEGNCYQYTNGAGATVHSVYYEDGSSDAEAPGGC